MLNWSIKEFEKLERKKNFEAMPKPFPGIDPIRWYVSVTQELNRKPSFTYLGKPNMSVARYVAGLFANPRMKVFYVDMAEFDRGSVFSKSNTFVHRIGGLPQLGEANNNLTLYYRPFTGPYPLLWANPRISRHKLTLNEKRIACYTDRTNVQEELWQRHKRWLELSGLVK